jgi:hypothetical protein
MILRAPLTRPRRSDFEILPLEQVVARCAISTTTGACFGGTVALIVHLLYTRITTGKGIWCA